MEVLNGSGEELKQAELGGQSLIQTIVSLTELPEPLVHQEMNGILQLSGHQSENLTLDQLRLAMLSYLEAIQAEMGEDFEPATEENDAVSIKTLVILE
jgi:hypothetical protein